MMKTGEKIVYLGLDRLDDIGREVYGKSLMLDQTR